MPNSTAGPVQARMWQLKDVKLHIWTHGSLLRTLTTSCARSISDIALSSWSVVRSKEALLLQASCRGSGNKGGIVFKGVGGQACVYPVGATATTEALLSQASCRGDGNKEGSRHPASISGSSNKGGVALQCLLQGQRQQRRLQASWIRQGQQQQRKHCCDRHPARSTATPRRPSSAWQMPPKLLLTVDQWCTLPTLSFPK